MLFFEMFRYFLVCLTLANSCFISAQSYSESALAKAICTNNWPNTTQQLELFFKGYEVSIHDSLYWHPEHFTNLINYYNNSRSSPAIVVSNFPAKESVWDYWQNWSDLLTNGVWEPKESFKSEREAQSLAQYNVLMLLSHELGHHIAHRYRVNNGGLSCQEYLADLASVALISSFSEKGYLHKLQTKYLSLIEEINLSIPRNTRFDKIDFNLHNFCDSLPVIYPSDSSLMPQYASAYFMRRLYLDSNNGFKDAQEMMDEIYLKKHNAWLGLYPGVDNKMELISRYKNIFNYDNEVEFNRSIAKWRGGKSYFAEYNGYAFSSDNLAIRWDAYIPSDNNYGSALISARELDGLLINNWVVPPGKLVDSNIRAMDVWLDGETNDLHLLVQYRSKGVDSLVLFSSNGSTSLHSKLLFVSSKEARYDLVWMADKEVVLLKSESRDKKKMEFKAVNHSLITNDVVEFDLFTLDVSEVNTTFWEASCNERQEYLIAINGYVLSYKNGIINTVAGTGLMGDKLELREFAYPRALSNLGDTLYLLSESKELWGTRSELTILGL